MTFDDHPQASSAAASTPAIQPIRTNASGHVILIDQRKLPFEEVYLTCRTATEVAGAIRDMVVRGAPAIGVTAALGLSLGAAQISADGDAHADRDQGENIDAFAFGFGGLCEIMAASRPTAINLFWAIDRMKAVAAAVYSSPADRLAALAAEAQLIYADDIAINRSIGAYGVHLVPNNAGILTHCNTGSLATAGYGTALGVIRAAHAAGKEIAVYADETRPYLQGSRLTAWECLKEGIDVTILADSAAGSLMSSGVIQMAIVGADRVAANGDTANKIGTYPLAVMCARHNIPFYVAAPTSTVDLSLATGARIPIEQRPPEEVTHVFGRPIAPPGVKVFNPSFDVTPGALIAGIITEAGIAKPPFEVSLKALVASAGHQKNPLA